MNLYLRIPVGMVSLRLYVIVLLTLCLCQGYGQAPVITPKPGPVILHLDASGKYVTSLADIASVTGITDPSTQVTMSPLGFDCSTLGAQTVTITATNGTFSTPTTPSASSFGGPWNITIDAAGNLYFSDFGNNKIKKITPFGAVSTIAGSGNKACNDGIGTAASFSYPIGVVTDNAANVYVADALCNVIKKITPSNVVTTFAGDGTAGYLDGTGTSAEFNTPLGLTIDVLGNIYVADQGNERIRKITPAGVVTTVAGDGNRQSVDGITTSASFSDPSGLAFDATGNLYVTDAGSSRIREISPSGSVSTIAGTGTAAGSTDGPVSIATFDGPYGIAIDKAGNLFIADRFNNEIREITTAGIVSTFAGTTALGSGGGSNDGVGTAASFSDPTGLVFDADGDLFVADRYNHKIRKITPDGTVSTFAGDGNTGDIDGNIGGAPATGQQSTLVVPVTVLSTPVFSAYQDVVINADVSCNAALPDYTIKPNVTENCPAVKLNVIQSPAAGTILPYNKPTKVTLNADDGYGGTAAVSFNVTITNKPVITPRQGILINLDATGNYTLKLADVATVTSCLNPSPVVTLNPASFSCADLGSKTVTVTADDGSGSGNLAVLTIPVTVLSYATLSTNLVPNEIVNSPDCTGTLPDYTSLVTARDICTGAAIPFTQTPQPGTTITAGSPVMVTVSTTSTLLHMVSTTFTVTLVPTNTPTVAISSSTGQVCMGSPVTFNAQVTGGSSNISYQWLVNGNNAGSNNPVFTTTNLNNNDVVKCAVTSGGCATPVLSNQLTTTVNPVPTITFSQNPIINEGSSIKLQPLVTGGIASYSWMPATGLSDATIPDPVASPANTTTYELSVNTLAGCQAAADITVVVLRPIVIPNAFTPNGDGINDEWNIKNLGGYLNCTVNIFNRYGQLVFHSIGYGQPWNGTSNGAPVPAGVYYYIIDLKNGTPAYSGDIALVK